MGFRRGIGPWALGWAAVVLLIVLSFSFDGMRVRDGIGRLFAVERDIRHSENLLANAVKAQLDEETGVRGYVATGDPDFLAPYHVAHSQLPVIFDQLDPQLQYLHVSTGAVRDARKTNDAWIREVAQPVAVNRSQNSLQRQRYGKALVDRFRADAAITFADLAQLSADVRRDAQDAIARLGLLIAIAAVLLLTSGLAFVALGARAWSRSERLRHLREEALQRENALRAAYEAEKHTVETLQQVFSTRTLPTVPGIRFSAMYEPAAEEAKIGGDWYDAFELPNRRILVVIGDVAGHGLAAAATMSRLREEVFAAALYEPDVESILSRVNDRIFTALSSIPMVTAIVGIVSAESYEFVYAAAGHPPPVLVETGRHATQLPCGGLPLGVLEKAAYRPIRVATQPGATLVLYTDGAVEHSRDIVSGERTLLAAIDATASRNEPARALYGEIFGHRIAHDDVAILTIGFVPTVREEMVGAAAAPSSLRSSAS